jgi:SAM-dependent methyltransferase
LEVGAAYGHTLLALRQLGYQVLALDLPESVDVYGKALIDSNVAIIPWDIHRGECPVTNIAQIVIASEVLEHLQVSIATAVRALLTPLSPGGILIVTTPNICRLPNVAKMLLGRNIQEPFPDQPSFRNGVVVDNRCHPREPGMQELRSAFISNGLTILEQRRFCCEEATGLRRLAYKLLPICGAHLLLVGRKNDSPIRS